MTAKSESRLPKGDGTQFQKFVDAARKAECDPNERRWTERLKKVVKQTDDSE